MYSYEWDAKTGGYTLTVRNGHFVANEIRPVFAEELTITGLAERFEFDEQDHRPLMWARQNSYWLRGEEVARLRGTKYGADINIEWRGSMQAVTDQRSAKKKRIQAVDLEGMLQKNQQIMDAMVADALKRIKELYDSRSGANQVAYIGYSGGKDSAVLLDLCHKVLPLTVPVVFSDTDMELPDTYDIWKEAEERYDGRRFIKAKAPQAALDNWRTFGPPSRTVRWCCAVHKSAPALMALRHHYGLESLHATAFVGVRSEESIARSEYDDVGDGVKVTSQTNVLPIRNWGAHEIWLHVFGEKLPIHRAYRYGLARVGCVLCPGASDKYAWYVDKIYPKAIDPYITAIVETSAKEFQSDADISDYIGSSNWQARRSGVTLEHNLKRPTETTSGNTVEWRARNLRVSLLKEWIKTVGVLRRDDSQGKDNYYLKMGDSEALILPVYLHTDDSGQMIFRVTFSDDRERRRLIARFRIVLQKTVACIGCQACEAECPTGAIKTIPNGVSIDEEKCIHCLRCHNMDYGCWRFKSMYVSPTIKSSLSGMNAYNNFGLRRAFLSIYIEERELFDQTLRINRAKQVPAAKAWFRQGLLMDAKTSDPTRLLDLFDKKGIEYPLAWDCVWLGLCNNAPLVKWVVCNLELEKEYLDADIFELLGTEVKEVTKKGGMQALKNMLISTPFGEGDGSVCEMLVKGKLNIGFVRRSRQVDPLVTLYGIYVMAEKSNRGNFTVRQMLSADFESDFVSPVTVFGMSPDELKKQILGLANMHPEFVACSFTLGLDEVRVFPDKHSKDDVVELMLSKA